ncbi:hypothetical protein K525DRAFT_253110 [Schizophyllum commune Loenen D]|nr:hypothetical protein K525DRAFT_253110 [Schizophyllum commune Loenen D]
MAFDLLIFALTAYKTISGVWQRGLPLAAHAAFDKRRIMSLVNVANVLTYYAYFRGMFGPLVNSICVALASRMMLNLHHEAHHTTDPSSIQLTTLAITLPRSDAHAVAERSESGSLEGVSREFSASATRSGHCHSEYADVPSLNTTEQGQSVGGGAEAGEAIAFELLDRPPSLHSARALAPRRTYLLLSIKAPLRLTPSSRNGYDTFKTRRLPMKQIRDNADGIKQAALPAVSTTNSRTLQPINVDKLSVGTCVVQCIKPKTLAIATILP